MLEHEESAESGHEEQEKGDVGVDCDPVMEETTSIFEEDALESEFSSVEAHHADDENGQKEADDGDCDFPSSMGIVKSELV